MIPSINDVLIKEIEAAAHACGHGWYDKESIDSFPDTDEDLPYVLALSPERALQIIRRLREAEARLSSLAHAACGPDRLRTLREAGDAIDYLRDRQEAA